MNELPTYRTASLTYAIQQTEISTGVSRNIAGAAFGAYFGPQVKPATVKQMPVIEGRKAQVHSSSGITLSVTPL